MAFHCLFNPAGCRCPRLCIRNSLQRYLGAPRRHTFSDLRDPAKPRCVVRVVSGSENVVTDVVGTRHSFFSRDSLARHARRHDQWRTWDRFLRSIRQHTLFFSVATGVGQSNRHRTVFQPLWSRRADQRSCLYLAAGRIQLRSSQKLAEALRQIINTLCVMVISFEMLCRNLN